MKIRISCTSYLLPGNAAWQVLQAGHELVFGEFGDWPQVLTASTEEEALCWVVFPEDLLPKDFLFSNNSKDAESAKALVDIALRALQFRLNNSTDAFTFVAWLGWQPDSVIRSAQQKTLAKIVTDYFDQQLHILLEKNKRLYLLALDTIFGEEGYKKCTDSRNFFLSRNRLSQTGLKLLAGSLNTILERIKKPAAKLLVLDCDNTLWGGVVGERGVSGIQIGNDGVASAFAAFQKAVLQLSKNGLLLAISSKNEAKDVWAVFDEHASMILKREDIIIAKIDWRDKSLHLQEIANEIGIGLDSVVFWDDNPVEREKVKQSLPQVVVIEPPAEVVEWYDTVRSLPQFASFHQSKEDLAKVSQYKAKAAFETETKTFGNYNDFLVNIQMVPSIKEINEGTIGRAVQLSQKTNQLNLRLERNDETSLQTLIKPERTVSFMVHLDDKFGDHGIIALAVAIPTEKKETAFLHTFLMSCRVLGRNLEGWIFHQLKERLLAAGFSKLQAEYVYGERNSPAKNLLSDYGFIHTGTSQNNTERKENYSVELNHWIIPHLTIFTIQK